MHFPLHPPLPVDKHRVLDTLVDNLDGMTYRCRCDAAWSMKFVSRGCIALTGYAPEDIVNNTVISWEEITLPEDRQSVREKITAAAGERFSIQYRIRTRSGQTKWVMERGIEILDEGGEKVLEGFIEDITESLATLEALEHAELRYRHIFEHASEGIFQTTQAGRYLAVNPALAGIYGYSSPEDLINDLSDIERQLYVESDRREQFQHLMETHGMVTEFESEVYQRDGSKIWIAENAHVVRDAQGGFICYEGTVHDITERRLYQAQLEHQANYDPLTGLPNRNLLSDRITQAISRAQRFHQVLAVVFVDLDNFKFINDNLGHDIGDRLLVEIASRIRDCLRTPDTVARYGGDEFVLLLTDNHSINIITTLLERILQVITRPVLLAGREFQTSASLGVALYPQDGGDMASLLRHADIAMYAAKDHGRNNFKFFTHTLNEIANERLNLETALRAGLEKDEFFVVFQPKVDSMRRIVGVEALARWNSADYGMVGPDRFIPIAEETRLIAPLTDIILCQAFEAAKAWPQVGGRDIKVAVNLSPRLFLDDEIVSRIARLLHESGLPAERVELEITESVFLGDSERAVGILIALKELGMTLAMDDFGTGYSSLSYLLRFPLDIIKIDRSLVTDIENNEEIALITSAVLSLSQALRKTVVAEGVENEAQFDFLRDRGCDEFQGYYLSKPIRNEALWRLLETTEGQL